MKGKVALILAVCLSCVIADYVQKKSCRQECSVSLPCKHGYVCKSVGCNRVCRRVIDPVWPVDPVVPVNPILPVDPIDPGFPGCIHQCQTSSECGKRGVCVRRGCRRVCEIRTIDPLLPIDPVIPGLPGVDCRDECVLSIQCGPGANCVRRGCRRVCEDRLVVDPTYPKGCVDQCGSSKDCHSNQICLRRGCRNVCVKRRLTTSYEH